MKEVKSVANMKGITISESYLEKNLSAMGKMPFETTSSMHRDKRAGKQIEIESLAKYLINEAEFLNIETQFYNQLIKSYK